MFYTIIQVNDNVKYSYAILLETFNDIFHSFHISDKIFEQIVY